MALILVGLVPVLLVLIFLMGSGLGCGSGFSTADGLNRESACGLVYAAAAWFSFTAMFVWPIVVLWIVAFIVSGLVFVAGSSAKDRR